VLFSVDTGSPAELARHVQCPVRPTVNWERDRVVLLAYEFAELSVRTVRDDGATQTLVITPGARRTPADPLLDYGLALALVPRERRASFIACP
jgi:hypothetical protein